MDGHNLLRIQRWDSAVQEQPLVKVTLGGSVEISPDLTLDEARQAMEAMGDSLPPGATLGEARELLTVAGERYVDRMEGRD